MVVDDSTMISADDEWSPLRSIIVGRAEHSCFPAEPPHAIEAIMPKGYWHEFRPGNPFPPEIVEGAQRELDNFVCLLETYGVHVYRPKIVDWREHGGYTGAMARDALMTVGNTLIESAYAFQSRRREVELGYTDILDDLVKKGTSKLVRAPLIVGQDTIYDRKGGKENGVSDHSVINNSRVAFDTADFMRFGRTIIGQLSLVTNERGIDYVRAIIPEGYTVELLETAQRTGKMHIDTTILPLRKGVLIYCAKWVTEEGIRRHDVFKDWELFPYPFEPTANDPASPPQYTCSPWLVLNALSLDERRIFVEEKNSVFAEWLKDKFSMEPILIPFEHVFCIGGSFHCATVDLVRSK